MDAVVGRILEPPTALGVLGQLDPRCRQASGVPRIDHAFRFKAQLAACDVNVNERSVRDSDALAGLKSRHVQGGVAVANPDRRLVPMPREVREAEARTLAQRLSDELTLERVPRRELAVEVDRHLTRYIAGVTGQHVRSSTEVRGVTLVGLAFPFALGACDVLSGDVAIFRDTGLLEAHIIAHEFSHRKGYWKELYAQVLGYLALVTSGEPALRQSARLERLHRDLRVLAGDDPGAFDRLVTRAPLRPELRALLMKLRAPLIGVERRVENAMRRLYHLRMRATGQTGISDYDLGFTNFLYTFETSTTARQTPP